MLLDELKDSVRELDALKYRKQVILQNVQSILSERKSEIDQDVIDYFYWETDFNTQFFPLRSGELNKVASTKYEELICPICHEVFHFKIKSRSHYKECQKVFGRLACYECSKKAKVAHEKEHLKWVRQRELQEKEEQEYIQKLRSMPYKEYLQTEHWQEFRKRVLRRANYACQLCSAKVQLNVHHRDYSNRGQEDYSDVIILCQSCHSKFHDK